MGWHLLVPFFVSVLLSVGLFTLVLLITLIFTLGGVVLWAFSSTAQARAKSAAILSYGLAIAPAPTTIMILALLTT